jgi:hypothetical protein
VGSGGADFVLTSTWPQVLNNRFFTFIDDSWPLE